MTNRVRCAAVRERILSAGILVVVMTGASGCASEPPKPAQTVTPDQVRGHADKTFERLKQDEQGRSVDSTAPR
ncbi:MAG TPA: hypothetical protein VLS44_03150 [Nitrospira sp.]|nr:hypothetical protein [Nitrospira sp.]